MHCLPKIGCSWAHPPLLAPTWDQFPWIDYLSAAREDLSDLASNGLWLAKDPRLCLTYPAYVHVLLRRVPLLAAIREPLSVAGSLFARNGLPVNAGLCLWFLYNHHLSSALAADEPLVNCSRSCCNLAGMMSLVPKYIDAYALGFNRLEFNLEISGLGLTRLRKNFDPVLIELTPGTDA